jgi:hypothetical protein
MRCFQVLFRALVAPAIFGFIVASVLPATAAVYSPRQALPSDTIQQFLANPAALLSQYPNGGPQMIARVRDLVASDPATVDVVLGLLKNANDAQATAIGTAYGQVALMAVGNDPPFATDLQTKVAQSGNIPALVAFSAVVGGDIKLSAATGPGGGIGGGGESQTSSSSGLGGFFAGSSFSLNEGVHNTPDEFSIPNPGGGGPGSNSVSAH